MDTHSDRNRYDDSLDFSFIDPSARVFLWLGQMRPYKGLTDWLPAILQSLAGFPTARLILAGRCDDPTILGITKTHSQQVHLLDRHVEVGELHQLASAADFGLLTYNEILTSGAMFHLYGLGLPVIAPDQGVLPAYVIPGWNGFLYRNEVELDAAIVRACQMNELELSEACACSAKTADMLQWGSVIE